MNTLEDTVRLSDCAIAADWTAICRCWMRSATLHGPIALAQLRLQERVSVVQLIGPGAAGVEAARRVSAGTRRRTGAGLTSMGTMNTSHTEHARPEACPTYPNST